MKKIFCCFVIAILSVFLTSAHAADEGNLLLVKWGPIDGNVLIEGYRGYSYANEVSMGISNDCTFTSSSGCEKYFDGLTITQYASSIGAQLASFCAKGATLDEVIIVSLISAKSPIPLWEIKLEPVIIQKISSAMNTTDGFLWEAVEVLPIKIKWLFYTYDPQGEPTGYRCTEWNSETGAVDPYCKP